MQNFDYSPIPNPIPARDNTIQVAGVSLDFSSVQIDDQTPTGRQLALAAGLRNIDNVVVLQMLPDGQLEDIRPDEVINLVSSTRKFIIADSDRTYNLTIDGSRISWPAQLISGAQLRKLGNVPNELALFQELTDAPDKCVEATELINLGESGVEKFVSRTESWKLNVQGVLLTSTSPTIVVREALIKAKFDVTQGWQIFLKIADKPKRAVELDTVIDLREPGIEKLRLTPREVNNGEGIRSARRDFSLLEVDEHHLDNNAVNWSTVVEHGRRWLIIDQYRVPPGYAISETQLALEIPATYPGSQIDMFYFYPPVARPDGQEIPATQIRAMIEGVQFHGWSRHRGAGSEWKVGVDNVVTHLALVESALFKEVE